MIELSPYKNSSKISQMSLVEAINEATLVKLECPVCLELPKKPIYQCSNGHLICQECYPGMKNGCPVCQVKLNKEHPIRNLIADDQIDQIEKIQAEMQDVERKRRDLLRRKRWLKN